MAITEFQANWRDHREWRQNPTLEISAGHCTASALIMATVYSEKLGVRHHLLWINA